MGAHTLYAPRKRVFSQLSMVLLSAIVLLATVAMLATEYYLFAFLPSVCAIALLLLARYPQFAFYTLVFFIIFTSFLGFTQEMFANLTINKLMGGFLVAYLCIKLVISKRIPQRLRTGFWKPLVLYMAAAGISLAVAVFPGYSWGWFLNLVTVLLVFTFTLLIVTEDGYTKTFPGVVLVSVFLSMLISLGLYAMGSPLAIHEGSGRFQGTVGSPNHYCFAIIFCLPIAAHFALHARSGLFRFFSVLTFVIGLLNVILTYSRGGFLVTLVVLSGIVILNGSRLNSRLVGVALSLFVAAMAATIITIPDDYWQRQQSVSVQDPSVSNRISYIHVAVDAFLDRPVVGSGPGAFSELYARSSKAMTWGMELPIEERARDAHNTYLEVLVGQGLIGLALFLVVICMTLGNFHRAAVRFRGAGRDDLAALTWSYMLSFIGMITYFLLLSRVYSKYFWILVAMSQVALYVAENRGLRRNAAEGAPRTTS